MIHPTFRKSRITLNATYHDAPGYARCKIDGGLTYKDASGAWQSAWVGGYDGPNGPKDWSTRWQEIIPEKLDAFAQSIDADYFALNVEHYGPDKLGRLVDIIERIRAASDGRYAIGVWSIVPRSDWSTLKSYAEVVDYQAGHPHFDMPATWWAKASPARVLAYKQWQEANELAAKKLVPHVDFLMPSIYPVKEPDRYAPDWSLAREPDLMIAECRRLAPELPVLACYYPYISALRKPASETVNRVVLDAARGADGTVIWADGNITPEQGVAVLNTATATANVTT